MASPDSSTLSLDQTLQQAITHHRAGQMQDAERLYRAILQVQPNHPDANHNLGVLAVQVKQPAVGLPHFKAALDANPSQAQYWFSYVDALIQTGQTDAAQQVLAQARQRGLRGEAIEALAGRLGSPSSKEVDTLSALIEQGRHTEAEILARSLTARFPLQALAWKILGASLQMQGKDALLALQMTAQLLPDDAEAHQILGNALQDLGQLDGAVASYGLALKIKPDYDDAYSHLGTALRDLGQLEEAQACFERAVALNSDCAEAHNNLGTLLSDRGRLDEAQVCFERALAFKADCAEAHESLGSIMWSKGRREEAKACYGRALVFVLKIVGQSPETGKTREARRIFVNCAKRLRFGNSPVPVRNALVRALSEPWCRPSVMTGPGCALVKLGPETGECVARASAAWPLRLPARELYGLAGLAAVAADTLLCALLDSAPVNDMETERFLTMVRRSLLESATGATAADSEDGTLLGFYGALARQCFINEYVFAWTSDEADRARTLRDSLVAAMDAQAEVPALWLVAVASYFPLHSLPVADRLLDRTWPEAADAVLRQQVRESGEELKLRATIPKMTAIDDDVSMLVQRQYEENPYPRWVRTAYARKPLTIDGVFRQRFPLSDFQPFGVSRDPEILVAGCGTGQHPIETAWRFRGARILAVDLSLASLCYARRKTRELGLQGIEYAQADILELGSLGRSFDVIESAGVLHHLADPLAGWRVLLSLLRPVGFMGVGFYSELARRNIVKARAFIAERGYGSSADEIRRCRQDLVDLSTNAGFGNLVKMSDFYSISTCRDLLFHVQEHRMTLTGIEAFLRANDLAFLGFEIDTDLQRAYVRRFPDDRAATNLGQWQTFENENPDTFLGMYQFWIQKIKKPRPLVRDGV